MKKSFYTFFVMIVVLPVFSQDWTWMHGPNIINTWGYYGTLGVSSSTTIPGSRHGCGTWTDGSGNLWLFGGEGLPASGTSGWLNDLWKYDPLINEWTWMKGSNVKNQAGVYGIKGVSSPSNNPGAREFPAKWKDAAGNFWMYGGDGYDSTGAFGNLNDLWKFDPITMEWTWISGSKLCNQNGVYGVKGTPSPNNFPGGRWAPSGVCDASGNFLLFGGYGWPASGTNGELNDLWKFNPTTLEWTWLSGSNLMQQNGNYGVKGTMSATNMPGGRTFHSKWLDASGNLWIMGGQGLPAVGTPGYLNDLWKYDVSSNQWTWVSGSNTTGALGVYGSQGVASPTNSPGGRYSHVEWQDALGNFWLFSGLGFGSSPGLGRLNDIWKYNPVTNAWTWIRGYTVINQYATYGTQGVSTPMTQPGGRDYSNVWTQTNGLVWVWGGFSFPVSGAPGNTNDLWKLTPSCAPDDFTQDLSICEGDSATLAAITSGTGTISWYNSAGASTAIATGTSINTPTLSAGSYTYFAEVSTCSFPRTQIVINVDSFPSITASTSSSLICAGQTATLIANGASSYTWNTSANGFSIAITPTATTNYWVMAANNSCADTAYVTQNVSPCLSVDEFQASGDVLVYPNPNNGRFKVYSQLKNSALLLFNTLGQEIYSKELTESETEIEVSFLSRGVYYFRINSYNSTGRSGKLMIE